MKPITHNNIYDSILDIEETRSWYKFKTLSRPLHKVMLSRWFDFFFTHHIVPTFVKIGFRKPLISLMFKMTAPAWETMGPLFDETYCFYPNLEKELRTIRKAFILREEKKQTHLKKIKQLNTYQIYNLFTKKIDAVFVENLVNEIDKSWVILPRAYSLLEKEHAAFLPIYLKHVNHDQNPVFLKVLLKILIEYSANFSLKYMHNNDHRRIMCKALFYGYAAMFWRNLRHPPEQYEDMLIFDIFYQWIVKFIKLESITSNDISGTVENMKRFRELFFPSANIFGFSNSCVKDNSWFLVSIRHGEKGVSAALNHFGPYKLYIKNTTQGGVSYIEVPKSFWTFLKKVKQSLVYETQGTKRSFLNFISKLKVRYKVNYKKSDMEDTMKFTGQRVLQMVNEFSDSMPVDV